MKLIRLISKLLFIAPIIVLIIGFNYYVDPANIFKGNGYYKDIVSILLKRLNVAGISNMDERSLQKEYISRLPEKKDVVVLGPSQIMQINSGMFPGYSFVNNGVSGASIEDDMAMYWMYRKKGFIPSKVLIGLSPWLLNKYNGQERYKTLLPEYGEMMRYIKATDKNQIETEGVNNKYYELISPSYFQSAFWYWITRIQEKNGDSEKPYYSTSKNEDNVGVKHSDGSISYDIKYRSILPSKVYSGAVIAVSSDPSTPYYSLGKFDRLDPDLIDKFGKFIDLMQKDRVEVIFILQPYHPEVYNRLIKINNYRIIVDAEKYFITYAESNKIRVIGSYNPAVSHLNNSDFLDDQHLRQEAINKMHILPKL
jgi:hypothetical protein